MKKKHYAILALLLFINIFILKGQNTKFSCSLSGVIKNFTDKIEIEDMSEIGTLSLPNFERTLTPDSNGNFSITFKIRKPNYFRVGRNIIYLSPGDKISAFIDFENPEKASFSGNNFQANEYLKKTPFPKGGSFLGSGDNIKSSIQKTIDTILVLANNRKKELYSHSNIPIEFKSLESARIKADILNSLYKIYTYFSDIHKVKKDSLLALKADCEKAISPYIEIYAKNFINPAFLKLAVYRDIISNIFKEKQTGVNVIDSMKCRDWIKARHLSYQLEGVKEKSQLLVFKDEITKIKTTRYRNLLTQKLTTLLKFGNGDSAVDFIALDNNNVQMHLLDFKGKVIYIDIWATWCGPCLEELPYLDKLKTSFAKNNDIVFLSLSVDDNKELWKQNLKKRNAAGLQWVISKDKLKQYSVVGIPRVIIINKAFRIEEMNGLSPADSNILNYLNNLLHNKL